MRIISDFNDYYDCVQRMGQDLELVWHRKSKEIEWEWPMETNCSLKNLEFFKQVDTYQAFQRIQMWLSNVAAPPKEIPHISDADMLECKGFDPKYSFRMSSPGKKRKKRKNK